MQVKFFNRHSGQIEIEKVMSQGILEWFYSSFIGNQILKIIIGRFFSQFMGYLQDLPSSRKKIPQFIKNFSISISDFIPETSDEIPYKTFNNFFIRSYKEGIRPFVKEPNLMPAFCEARYLGFKEVHEQMHFPIKGNFLSAAGILSSDKWNETFKNGPLFIARLCPVDYHWFHFLDDGQVLDEYRVEGKFHSVSPIALKTHPEVFCTNERHVTILETKNFGKIAFVEVGALCVGKIVQTYNDKKFKRGDKKGHFLFGGSTVVILGEKGKWQPDEEICFHSLQGIEVWTRLGTAIAKATS